MTTTKAERDAAHARMEEGMVRDGMIICQPRGEEFDSERNLKLYREQLAAKAARRSPSPTPPGPATKIDDVIQQDHLKPTQDVQKPAPDGPVTKKQALTGLQRAIAANSEGARPAASKTEPTEG